MILGFITDPIKRKIERHRIQRRILDNMRDQVALKNKYNMEICELRAEYEALDQRYKALCGD